jgi:hypothetical protein
MTRDITTSGASTGRAAAESQAASVNTVNINIGSSAARGRGGGGAVAVAATVAVVQRVVQGVMMKVREAGISWAMVAPRAGAPTSKTQGQ